MTNEQFETEFYKLADMNNCELKPNCHDAMIALLSSASEYSIIQSPHGGAIHEAIIAHDDNSKECFYYVVGGDCANECGRNDYDE